MDSGEHNRWSGLNCWSITAVWICVIGLAHTGIAYAGDDGAAEREFSPPCELSSPIGGEEGRGSPHGVRGGGPGTTNYMSAEREIGWSERGSLNKLLKW